MKSLKQLIKEQEEKDSIQYDIPPEILDALEVKLKMHPLIRYVKELKALNSIPPAYTIFLHTGQDFDIFYEDFSLMVKIQGREYYLLDLEERSNAIEHLNRLLMMEPVPSLDLGGEDEEEEEEEEGGGNEEEPSEGEPVEEPIEEPAEEEPEV